MKKFLCVLLLLSTTVYAEVDVITNPHQFGVFVQGGPPVGWVAQGKLNTALIHPENVLSKRGLTKVEASVTLLFAGGLFYGYAFDGRRFFYLGLGGARGVCSLAPAVGKTMMKYDFMAWHVFPKFLYGNRLFCSVGVACSHLIQARYVGVVDPSLSVPSLVGKRSVLADGKRFTWALVPGLGYRFPFGLFVATELTVWSNLHNKFFQSVAELVTKKYDNELAFEAYTKDFTPCFQAATLMPTMQLVVGYDLVRLWHRD